QATRVYPGNDEPAVDAFDLDIAAGEFVVLVGPSGSGKTTALRMLAGLEEVDAGAIYIGERDVTYLAPKDRDVAMVFQNYALYPYLTVAANIGFPLKVAGVKKAERERRVREVAELLELTDYLSRKPKQLSGGQRQRVAMGRAIVREPSVFLMDEPLSNLDAKLRVQMRSEVLRVHRSIGAATLYVTHDQTEAMTMGDRVAVLQGGVLQQYDTPRALYDQPANVFVATFIGSPAMNLYEAGLSADGASGIRPAVVLGSQRLDLPAPVAARVAAYQGRKVIVGVRPEDLVVSSGPGLVTEARIVEVLGSEQHVYFWLDATPATQAAAAAAATDDAAEGGFLGGGAPHRNGRNAP